MRLTENQRNKVWLHVFALTMRERAAISGSASDPERRFPVAVREADEAVATDATAESWMANACEP